MTSKRKQKPLSPLRQRAFAARDRFREIVKEKGWTIEQASAEGKFGYNTTGRWLRGDHAPTSRQMVEALERFNARHPIAPKE